MMKKLISLALTLAMLSCMATTAFAAKQSVVGSRTTTNIHDDSMTHTGTVDDGVGSFGNADATTNVDITVTLGDMQHRYAVDIDFEDIVLTASGSSMVWDVNELTYVSDGTANMANQSAEIKVYNYSDLPVYVTPEIINDIVDDGITIACTVTEEQEVLQATAKSGDTAGSATELPMTLSVTSTDWNAVADYYAQRLPANGGEMIAGSLKITVAKDPANP